MPYTLVLQIKLPIHRKHPVRTMAKIDSDPFLGNVEQR